MSSPYFDHGRIIRYRRKYLEQFGWTETVPKFIEQAKKVRPPTLRFIIPLEGKTFFFLLKRSFLGQQVDIDWDAIEEKLVDENVV